MVQAIRAVNTEEKTCTFIHTQGVQKERSHRRSSLPKPRLLVFRKKGRLAGVVPSFQKQSQTGLAPKKRKD